MYETLSAEFLKKTKFNFEIYDIDQRSKGAIRPDESILSYGVDLLNVELASLTQEGDYVLEVGCGRRSYFHEIKPKSTSKTP